MKKIIGTAALCAAVMGCLRLRLNVSVEKHLDKPGGFPERALTMIVPYGPAGGSGQVAAAMAEAVTN